MSEIFLSYRRGDSPGYAGRLYDRLRDHFGADHVFRDLDTLPPGADFVVAMEEAVGSCDALVALIGPEWLTVRATRAPAGSTTPMTSCASRLERRWLAAFPCSRSWSTAPRCPWSPSFLPRWSG